MRERLSLDLKAILWVYHAIIIITVAPVLVLWAQISLNRFQLDEFIFVKNRARKSQFRSLLTVFELLACYRGCVGCELDVWVPTADWLEVLRV